MYKANELEDAISIPCFFPANYNDTAKVGNGGGHPLKMVRGTIPNDADYLPQLI
jgi:hypothetical protein